MCLRPIFLLPQLRSFPETFGRAQSDSASGRAALTASRRGSSFRKGLSQRLGPAGQGADASLPGGFEPGMEKEGPMAKKKAKKGKKDKKQQAAPSA